MNPKEIQAVTIVAVINDMVLAVRKRETDLETSITPDMWQLPTGEVKEGETPVHTGTRKLWEETGIRKGYKMQEGQVLRYKGFVGQIIIASFESTGAELPALSPQDPEIAEAVWMGEKRIS